MMIVQAIFNLANAEVFVIYIWKLTNIRCDSPYALGLAALQSIGPLTGTGTGTDQADVAWTIYTGDLVSHDSQNQLSRAYVEYAETSKQGVTKQSSPKF